MQIFKDSEKLRSQCAAWRKAGETIALVPTMGYYHAGHESLMRHGRKIGDRLVVSLFVNPTQFGPAEDLSAYPRDFERDQAIAAANGADAIFAPEPDEMYASDHAAWVEVPELAKGLCGKSRPIHFRGVCTVVSKLFNIIQPDYAVFGEKDWQQQAIIRRMVRDLNFPVKIETCPIAREPDGLAMSSRNVYLTPEERGQTPAIRQGLLRAEKLAELGEGNASRLKQAVLSYWAENLPGGRLDYLEVVHPESLEPVDEIGDAAVMACAVRVGKARLLDNILLHGKKSQ